MNGLRDANRRIRRVVVGSRVYWDSLARWSATTFIAAAGLLLVTTVLFALEAFTALSPEGTVTGITSITGLTLSYVGLLGLYPRLADRTPRLALASVALVGLPAIALVVLLTWGVSGHALSVVPLPPDVIPAFGRVFVTVFLLFGMGITLFGVASLRSPSVSHTVGLLLLVLAATWFVLLGASSVYGTAFPARLDFAIFGVMAVTLLAIGNRFRTGPAAPDPDEVAADEPTDGRR